MMLYTVNLEKPHCQCDSWGRTGKTCLHMQAARNFDLMGTPEKWKGERRTQLVAFTAQLTQLVHHQKGRVSR